LAEKAQQMYQANSLDFWTTALAIVLQGADIIGHVALVLIGLYPTDIPGAIIVSIVALYF
jgi:hypothetical protein